MMRIRLACVTLSIVALGAVAIDAQDVFYKSWSSADQASAGVFIQSAPLAPGGVVALDPINVGRPVENAPYSAEAITEMTHVLADGNRIERRNSTNIARDSRGRTRREQQAVAVGSHMAQNTQPIVTITDPVSGVHLTLNYEHKLAFRSKPMRFAFGGPNAPAPVSGSASSSGSATVEAGGTVDANGSGGVVTYGTGAALVTKSGEARHSTAVGGVPAIETELANAVMFEMAVPPPGPGGASWSSSVSAAPFGEKPRTEKLEPRTIEGLRAEGTRTTMTIPAGAIGNASAIEVVSEQWFSPELQVVLMSRRTDPRFGETVYRLTNIVRTEPSPDLFKVPSDFKVQDMNRGFPAPVRPRKE